MKKDGKSLRSGYERLKFKSHTFRGVRPKFASLNLPKAYSAAGSSYIMNHQDAKQDISNFQEDSIKTKWDRRNAKNAVLELTSQWIVNPVVQQVIAVHVHTVSVNKVVVILIVIHSVLNQLTHTTSGTT